MKRSLQTAASTEYVDALHLPERRAQLRHQPRSLVYVELDEGNGGIALNVGEDGLAVQAVTSMMDDSLARLRFQLSESKDWIETSAQVVWANESRKLLGLRFVDLPERSRQQIREWLEREEPGHAGEASQIPSEGLEGRGAPPVIPVVALPTSAHTDVTSPIAPANVVDSHLDGNGTAAVPSLMSSPATAEPVQAAASKAADGATIGEPAESVFSVQRESFRAPTEKRIYKSGWSVAVLFLFLATASLAAGWAVGRGALADGIEMVRRAVARLGASGGAATAASARPLIPGRLSEIEIINASGARWTIPLTATSPGTPEQTRAESGGSSSPPSRRQEVPFKTWVLTAPLQARRGTAAPNVEAPAVGAATEPSQSAIPVVNQPYAIPAPPPPKQAVLRKAALIRRVDPIYPPLAVSSHVEGTVKMHLTITANGTVRDIRVVSGPPLLTDSAVKAARQWLYSPTLVDGKPSDSEADISVAFHLP